jgi:predicted RNA-binding protein associated with RNAse of E/G family
LGFVEAMTKHILSHIPTNPLWAETVSLTTLSSVLEGVRFNTMLGPLQLNLFSLCVGPSGLANKTLPLKNVAIPILRKAEQVANWKILLPPRFSLEGFIEFMSIKSSVGIIITDEFTHVIKEAYGKDYLSDIMEFLSELYDGTAQERYTRKTKLESSKRVYVSFMSATTPYLYTIMRPELFLQGTANRFLFVVFKEPNLQKYDSKTFFIPAVRAKEFDDQNEALGEYLGTLRTTITKGGWIVGTMDESAGILLEYRDYCYNKASALWKSSRPNDFEYSYIVRQAEMCFKLAAIKAIGDMYYNIFKTNLREITITPSQAKWAVEKMHTYEENFKRLLTDWNKYNIKKETVMTLDNYHDVVKSHIASAGGTISRSELLDSLKIRADVLDKALETMGDVETQVIKTGGRPRVIYSLKKT